MNKFLFVLLLSCLITSCNKNSEKNKEIVTYTDNDIKKELISNTTILIDSVFNEITPHYLSLKIDSINVYKYIVLKGERLEDLEFNLMTGYDIDKEFVDLFINSIESEKITKDSIIGYIGFLKVKSKISVKEEYIALLTDEQKLEAQRNIKSSDRSFFIPNILTSDFKQFDMKKLNKNN